MFFMILVLFITAMMNPVPLAEDDLMFNCHLNGNHICGQGTPWHGFVNLPGL